MNLFTSRFLVLVVKKCCIVGNLVGLRDMPLLNGQALPVDNLVLKLYHFPDFPVAIGVLLPWVPLLCATAEREGGMRLLCLMGSNETSLPSLPRIISCLARPQVESPEVLQRARETLGATVWAPCYGRNVARSTSWAVAYFKVRLYGCMIMMLIWLYHYLELAGVSVFS